MACIVYGRTIEEYEVLGCRAATHLIASGSVALALDARQQLYAFYYVALAKQCRHLRKGGHLYFLNTYLGFLHTFHDRTRRHRHLLQRVVHLHMLALSITTKGWKC